MTEKKAPAKVFDLSNLFGLDTVPEQSLDVSHLKPQRPAVSAQTELPTLEGKRKLLLVVGAGNTGKTLFLRWACQKPRTPWALLTLDTVNRELVHYFANVGTPPPGASSKDYLGRVVDAFLKDKTHSAAIDFGGGDTSLAGLANETPGLVQIMEAADLHPVLVVFLSKRVADLVALKALDEAGFQPRATALVLNMGLAESAEDYRPVVTHSVYQAAKARGAVTIYMPRLYGAGPAVEQRRLSFADAATEAGALSMIAQRQVFNWLHYMEREFEPISSWLP